MDINTNYTKGQEATDTWLSQSDAVVLQFKKYRKEMAEEVLYLDLSDTTQTVSEDLISIMNKMGEMAVSMRLLLMMDLEIKPKEVKKMRKKMVNLTKNTPYATTNGN